MCTFLGSGSIPLVVVSDSKVGNCVNDDDPRDRDAKTLIGTLQAIRLEVLGETVAQSIESTLKRPLAHIGSHSGHNKTQWAGSAEGSGPSCPIRSHVISTQGPQEDLFAHP